MTALQVQQLALMLLQHALMTTRRFCALARCPGCQSKRRRRSARRSARRHAGAGAKRRRTGAGTGRKRIRAGARGRRAAQAGSILLSRSQQRSTIKLLICRCTQALHNFIKLPQLQLFCSHACLQVNRLCLDSRQQSIGIGSVLLSFNLGKFEDCCSESRCAGGKPGCT